MAIVREDLKEEEISVSTRKKYIKIEREILLDVEKLEDEVILRKKRIESDKAFINTAELWLEISKGDDNE